MGKKPTMDCIQLEFFGRFWGGYKTMKNANVLLPG
jgi:hypothetical protein